MNIYTEQAIITVPGRKGTLLPSCREERGHTALTRVAPLKSLPAKPFQASMSPTLGHPYGTVGRAGNLLHSSWTGKDLLQAV